MIAAMIGAIAGDIIGSRFESEPCKTVDFELFADGCRPTDDTVMTLAVGEAVTDTGKPSEAPEYLAALSENAVRSMRRLGRLYPEAGYGGSFAFWLSSPRPRPYHSFGNGAAMRVSAVGEAAASLSEARAMSDAVTAVTHDHPEGLLGARTVASCIYLARSGASKSEIRDFVERTAYPLGFTLDSVRPGYVFDVTCRGSVPYAVRAFLEASDYEETVRLAVSLGGDSDTLAAIAGSIAEAYYGVPDGIALAALERLDAGLISVYRRSVGCSSKPDCREWYLVSADGSPEPLYYFSRIPVAAGDRVLVPYGIYGVEKAGRVIGIKTFPRGEEPVDPAKMKYVIAKI